MIPITEKVDDLLGSLLTLDLKSDTGIDQAKLAIKLAIKEQDRDTRHACAEACKGPYHDICMNVQAL